MNITINIDDGIIKNVQRIAVEKDTTIDEMVRDYLSWVAGTGSFERQRHAESLMETLDKVSRDMGPRNWRREDLYDR